LASVCTVLPEKRVHLLFMKNLCITYKYILSVFYNRLIEMYSNLFVITKTLIKSHDMHKGVWLNTLTDFTKIILL